MILILGTTDTVNDPPAYTALDVSDHVLTGYKIQVKSEYDSGFRAADGSEHRTRICDKVHISADLGELNATEAAAVMAKVQGDTIDVTYGSPGNAHQATFYKPEVSAEMIVEGNVNGYGELWDIHLDMESVALDHL